MLICPSASGEVEPDTVHADSSLAWQFLGERCHCRNRGAKGTSRAETAGETGDRSYGEDSMEPASTPKTNTLGRNVQVHTHACGERGIFVNAYLVETDSGVVAIDSTLTETESKELRREVEALKKPLLAVLIT